MFSWIWLVKVAGVGRGWLGSHDLRIFGSSLRRREVMRVAVFATDFRFRR